MFDVLGREVFSDTRTEIRDEVLELDLSGKGAGLYFIKIKLGEREIRRSVAVCL